MKLLLIRDADGAFTQQIKIGTADELKDHDPLREAVKSSNTKAWHWRLTIMSPAFGLTG